VVAVEPVLAAHVKVLEGLLEVLIVVAASAVVAAVVIFVIVVVVQVVVATIDLVVAMVVNVVTLAAGHGVGHTPSKALVVCNKVWNSSKDDEAVSPGNNSGETRMPVRIAHVTTSWHASWGTAVWQAK
jgi:hypothetical protein